MNRITKDTPVGTRVIAVGPGGTLYRGTIYAEPDRHRVEVTLDRINSSSPLVSCQLANVYLDEPAPGTWAWACERLFAGEVLRRPVWADGQAIAFNDNEDLAWVSGMFSVFVVDREDLTATDWEIAK